MSALPKPPECDGCPFHEIGEGFVPPDPVTPNTKLVVWGESPGRDEVGINRGFCGRSGRLLRRTLVQSGYQVWSPTNKSIEWDKPPKLGTEQVAMRNTMLCRPPGNSFPGESLVEECMYRHQRAFLEAGPTVPWLACGANATRMLTGLSINPTEDRGALLPYDPRYRDPSEFLAPEQHLEGWVSTSLHPAFISRVTDRDADEAAKAMSYLTPTLGIDIRRAVAGARGPNVPRLVFNPPMYEVHAHLETMPPKSFIAVDIEGSDGKPQIVGVSPDPSYTWVFQWTPEVLALLQLVFKRHIGVFHNGAYDIPELEEAGVPSPEQWIDTIIIAHLVNPSFLKRLEVQVLTWVAGTAPWKALVDHGEGYEARTPAVIAAEALWTEILTRLGRPVPADRLEWYAFYNALDTAYDLQLFHALRKVLEQQGRLEYYKKVLMPLQKPMIEQGRRGIPVDVDRMLFHYKRCERLEAGAKKRISLLVSEELVKQLYKAEAEFEEAHKIRDLWKELGGKGKYPSGGEIVKARAVVKKLQERIAGGFDTDSTTQRRWLLYEWMGLPPVFPRKKKQGPPKRDEQFTIVDKIVMEKKQQPSTDDETIEILRRRLTRIGEDGDLNPVIKPKSVDLRTCLRVLDALIAGKKWATQRRNFLSAPVVPLEGKRPRMQTTYTLHRADTGRKTSGTDVSDPSKGTHRKKKIQQLQNVPKRLRDAYAADEGWVMVGADYAGIEWALVMWYASKLPRSCGFHENILNAFQAGEFDPHRYLATFAFGLPADQITDAMRTMCKPYTHGRNYFGAPTTLARNAGHTDAVGIKVCAAHEKAFRPSEWWEYESACATKLKYVATPLGWRRYFWEYPPKPTEVYATKIQATAADLLKTTAVHLIEEELPKHPPCWEYLTDTHDSFLLHVPQEDAEEAKAAVLSSMQRPIPWLDGRSWRAEAKIGPNWRSVS